MKCFLTINTIYTGPLDSTYRICWPSYNDPTRPAGLTDDEFLDYAIQRMKETGGLPADAVVIIVDSEDLPTDEEFINAWAMSGSNVVVDMPKARLLHMEKIRAVRNAELAAKDITFMRAVEAGDASAQSTIAAEKQTLRDIPATFDITTDVDTPEKLKAKWPAELPARE